MPTGYSKDKYPEMYETKVMDRKSEYYNDSIPFLMKAWNRYLVGEYDKERVLKVVSSLAEIWEHNQ